MALLRNQPSTTLDLTLSDSDHSGVMVEQPVTKKARSSPRKKLESKKQHEEDDADAALARKLQAEEDEMAMQQDRGVGVSN